VYVPQAQVESEVLGGLRGLLDFCAAPQKFTRSVNKELRRIWEASGDFRPDAGERIAAIDRKVANIRRAVEDGLNDANWANSRLRELLAERDSLLSTSEKPSAPPQVDATTAMEYRRQAEKLLRQGNPGEQKKLLRTLVGDVKLCLRSWR
jgi:hypothetical protein